MLHFVHIFILTFVKVVVPVAIIVPIDAVDEIRVFKDTVVVESFGVDAQSFLLLEYLGQGLSQIGHLKPLSVGVTPSNTAVAPIIVGLNFVSSTD